MPPRHAREPPCCDLRHGSNLRGQDYSAAMASSQDLAHHAHPAPHAHHATDLVSQQAGVAEGQTGHGDRPAKTLRVLLYSDDRLVRADLIRALGPQPAVDLPRVEYVECATAAATLALVDRGGFDLLIFDGEAVPTGGMGLTRQVKDEIFNCPPVLVLIARPQDAWLATWSRAEAVALHPINALTLPGQVADLLRPAVARN